MLVIFYYNKPKYDSVSPTPNGVLDVDREGAVKYFWLSESSKFVKNDKFYYTGLS